MTYQLFRERSGFCGCTIEAWVLVGVICESHKFFGNSDATVRAQAIHWINDRLLHAE